MRILKKILKWALRVILIVVGLLLLVCVLVYIPPIQNFIKNQATAYVSRNMGMQLDVERLRLRFPLTLGIDNTMLRTVDGDTLLHVGKLRAGVSLLPLLGGNIEVRRFHLEQAAVNYSDSLGSMVIRGSVNTIDLRNVNVKLSRSDIRVGTVALEDADIDLYLGESPADTTSTSDTTAWKIAASDINLDRVNFRMRTEPVVTELTAVLERGRIDNANMDMAAQRVDVRSVSLQRGDYVYLTDTVTVAEPAADILPIVESRPWVISVGRVELEDNSGAYGTLYAKPGAGFDPSYIQASGINLRVDSLYNRSADIKAIINGLELKERSGLEVTRGEGRFEMTGGGLRLEDFLLTTAASRIEADAVAAEGILEMSPDAELTLQLNASLAPSDLFLLYPADARLRRTLAGKTLTAEANFDGRLGDIDINLLRVTMPSHISLDVNGNLASLTEPENMSGRLHLSGRFSNLDFVREFLPDSTRNRIGFPRNMILAGNLSVDRGNYAPDLRITADSGYLDLKGRMNLKSESYDATVAIVDFPLHSFLPADSLGLVSLDMTAAGAGFDFTSTNAAADVGLNISRFDYMGYTHHDLTLEAAYAQNRLTGTLMSDSEALQLDLALGGTLTKEQYGASVKGRITKADLGMMGLMETPFNASASLDISAAAATDTTQVIYNLDAVIDSVAFTHGDHSHRMGRTTIMGKADRASAVAAVRSGDLALDFNAPLSINDLSESFTTVVDTLMNQLDRREIDFRPVEDAMPTFDLTLSAGRGNVVHSIASESGFDFNGVSLTARNTTEDPFRVRGLVTSLKTAGLTLDTLNMGAGLKDEVFTYYVRLANRPGNIEQLALIYLYGTVQGDRMTANFNQRNREGEKGFVFGVEAQLRDSSIYAVMVPQDPTFAYEKWSLNPDNFVEYYFDNRIYANLEFEGQDVGPDGRSHIMVKSVDYLNMPPGSIRLDIANLDIDKVLDLLPAPPALDGVLTTNIAFGMQESYIAANGSVLVKRFAYDGNEVGDLSLTAIANTDDEGVLYLDAGVGVNERSALTVNGSYDISGERGMNLTANIPGLPMNIVNPFIPNQTVQLAGALNGEARLTGTPAALGINGSLNFTDGTVTVPMIGTTFGISAEPITIRDNRVRLRDFGLTAPNNRLLAVDGTIDIRDFSNMTTALVIFADDFQLVNAPRNRGSEIYGTANIDVDMTARGPIDELVLRGDLKLLRSTDVVYTMLDSSNAIEDQKQDIVTFVSFADSTAIAMLDSINRVRTGGMDLQVNIDIEDEVEVTVNLSDNGNDRIELIGGGNLAFIMSNQGDMRLTGRYSLSGGTVVYNPPIPGITAKNFTIDQNSYVSWTGEALEPEFHIRAVETVRTTISNDSGSQSVDFNISIFITGTLADMSMVFDMDTPNGDITLQRELAALDAEQRSTQALSLLIYNRYSGPGGSGSADGNSTVNSFIEKELNQWARNSLKNIDVSFGIQSQEDETGRTHTDYSYKVSKNLFNDRVKVTVGGTVSDNASTDQNIEDAFQDVSLEYRLTQRDNMYLKAYRLNQQSTVLEGEIVETGVGFIYRKRMERLGDLFKLNPATKELRRIKRESRRELRTEEERIVRDTSMRRRTPEQRDSIRQVRTAISDSLRRDTTYWYRIPEQIRADSSWWLLNLRDSLRGDTTVRRRPPRNPARFDSLRQADGMRFDSLQRSGGGALNDERRRREPAENPPVNSSGGPAAVRPNREAVAEDSPPGDNQDRQLP